ncbi:MAG: hypothetical protein ACRDGA_11000, partial [Bacteroidota bacterium]
MSVSMLNWLSENKIFIAVVGMLWLLTTILLLSARQLEQSVEATQNAAEQLKDIVAQGYPDQEQIKHLQRLASAFLTEEKNNYFWAELSRLLLLLFSSLVC